MTDPTFTNAPDDFNPCDPKILRDPTYTHERIAARLFSVPESDVTREQRKYVKSMRFFWLYSYQRGQELSGKSQFLSPTGRISQSEPEVQWFPLESAADSKIKPGDISRLAASLGRPSQLKMMPRNHDYVGPMELDFAKVEERVLSAMGIETRNQAQSLTYKSLYGMPVKVDQRLRPDEMVMHGTQTGRHTSKTGNIEEIERTFTTTETGRFSSAESQRSNRPKSRDYHDAASSVVGRTMIVGSGDEWEREVWSHIPVVEYIECDKRLSLLAAAVRLSIQAIG